MSEPRGLLGWLTVLFGVVFVAALAVWLFASGTVFAVVTVVAGVGLAVVAVVSAIVDRQPGLVLVGFALAGVGALLTAVVFGFAYLDASWTYVSGESTTARVASCEDDDCESTWTVGGQSYTDEVELAFDAARGEELPIRADGDDAVRAGGLTVLVVASSGVALVSPLLVLGGWLLARRQATARHQPFGGSAVDTSSS